MSEQLSVNIDRPGDLTQLGQEWRLLAQRAPHSFFLSPAWIESWLSVLPRSVTPWVVRVRRGGELVGLGVVVEGIERRRLVRSRQLRLHETAEPEFDQLSIEYNGMLLDPSCASAAAEAATEALIKRFSTLDEFVFGGLDDQSPLAIQLQNCNLGGLDRRLREESSHRIDLVALRTANREYLAALESPVRKRIVKARTAYAQRGELALECAETVQEAQAILDQLIQLHQQRWQGQGEPGAFENETFERFHRILIERAFGEGAIQLLRLRAGTETIGCLYNFRYAGVVSFYQSGFNFSDPGLSPGIVCHAAAIEHNLAQDALVYDFLAGDQQYKRQLAGDKRRLVWITLQRPRLRLKIEARLRALRAIFRSDA